MEFLKENKEAQDTGDKILSGVATLIQSSPAVNWRSGVAGGLGLTKPK
jgi:hypothetical protein